jgi:hypothetical protein
LLMVNGESWIVFAVQNGFSPTAVRSSRNFAVIIYLSIQ